MPELKPFRGIRYSPRAGSLGDLVAPPYDVVGDEEYAALCRRSPHNVVRLTLDKGYSPEASPPPEWYEEAARLLDAWLREGILEQDPEPAFYLYTEAFDYEGQRRCRKLLLGALRLEAGGPAGIFRHEKTTPGPKAGRLRLMQAARVNHSPILAFFPDPHGGVDTVLEGALALTPTVAFTDEAGIGHALRRILDPAEQETLAQMLAPLPLYIADGHHRYETALTYRREERDKAPDAAGDLPCDFVLAACMSGLDPGLVIRPTHRVLSWDGEPGVEELLAAARERFAVSRLDGRDVDGALAALAAREDCAAFALYGGRGAGFALLEARDEVALRDADYPAESPLRRLPAAVFSHAFVGKLLGARRATVSYTPDAAGAVREVDVGKARLACLLPSVRPDEVMAVVDSGELMPPKSTYFWPKPKTGIVLRSLRGF